MRNSSGVKARHVALLLLPFAILGVLVAVEWQRRAPQREQRARLNAEADEILAQFRGRFAERENGAEIERRYVNLVRSSTRKDAVQFGMPDAERSLREFIAALDAADFYERAHRKIVNRLRKRQREQAQAKAEPRVLAPSPPEAPLTLEDALAELEAKCRAR
ncbi:MAG: hypothetical protein L0Z55_03255 [Planctomycetes bacterium]|nr:hypothetical protein [Planctomycetota bacterium]